MTKDTFTLKLSEVPDGGALIVQPNRHLSLAVFRTGQQVYAIEDRCPHGPVSLARGALEGCYVSCPLHGLTFDVRTGEGPANWRIAAYPVRRRGDKVWIDLKKRRRKR